MLKKREPNVLSPDIVQKWCDAIQLYESGEFDAAVTKFKQMIACGKILFNIGCCHLSIDEIDLALKSYEEAIHMDTHMAVSYFMIGLIYYLKKEFFSSLEYFEKARTALRGNMYIDYSQLGLNYKLYACEIQTNQASILFKLNKIGKAKELLLLASTCKTEKRHNIISDSLNMLQAGAGYAMSMFTLPPNAIFRPSPKIVEQLKKKDYLGKSKVVATENTENIYACFSGLKATKDEKIPSHVKEEDVKTMLKDLKISDWKEKLKRTPPQKKLPVLNIGKVVENTSTNSKCQTTNNIQNGLVKKEGPNNPPPKRPPLPVQPAPKNYLSDPGDLFNSQTNTSRGPHAPPRPPPVKKSPPLSRFANSDSRNISSTGDVNKYPRKPSPLTQRHRPHKNNNGCYNVESSTNDKSISNKLPPGKQHFLQCNGDVNDNYLPSTSTNKKKVHEVEICYTFTHKIRLKEGLSLSEVRNIVEAQVVPDGIHMGTTDEQGRYRPLTEETLELLLKSNINRKEILCSTNLYDKNGNAPT